MAAYTHPAPDYTLVVDTSSQVVRPNPSPGSGSRTYAFTITLIPAAP